WLGSRRLRLSPRARGACTLVLAMALAQFGLGVATLLLVVPVGLAALHQAGALALLTLTLWAIHVVRPAPGAAIVIPAGKAD
ncbi:MAG: COX15/CtaA family protein, partial [Proteobacteria bacterium]|nr:COX15/CtaA family protein [Pseudomonadota bacterium]